MAGSAVKKHDRRLVYVLAFECEKCKGDVYAYFRTEEPELDFQLTCPCGWAGTRRSVQAKRVFCRDADSPSAKR